jgi:hypothetical protein
LSVPQRLWTGFLLLQVLQRQDVFDFALRSDRIVPEVGDSDRIVFKALCCREAGF